MTDTEFNKLLGITARHTARAQELSVKVSNECIRRYGAHYSDVDACEIIDILDYLGGYDFSVKEFNHQMIAHGAKRIAT